MENFDYRIFLSYRGDSDGLPFVNDLFDYYKEDPFWFERYGNIYLSTKTDKTGNFIKDIPYIMKNVEYFIIPLTKEYFDDFWNEELNCPDENSVTYKEIIAAMHHNAKFVCIAFPHFSMDISVIKKIFDNNAEFISGAKRLNYTGNNRNEIFMQICDATLRQDISFSDISNIIGQTVPNVYMSFKRETEDKYKYPFYEKLYDVTSITLLNYASSTFISGIDIAMVYQENDSLKRWFSYHLARGDINANIILTNPVSAAAKDAADYKMYPDNRNVPKDEIILQNMNKLFAFMKENPKAKLNVYLTNIALPYGIMITEHRNPKNNHMKVDIYSPVIESDRKRPSFYLLQNDHRTSALYDFFKSNVQRIMNNYAYPFDGHPDVTWMTTKHTHIIHRGIIRKGLAQHTQNSFIECIDSQLPMEVDLLPLNDETGTVIVGREDQTIDIGNDTISVANCRMSEIRKINRKLGNDKILTLDELLNLVNGKIPLLLEIKTNMIPLDEHMNHFVENITQLITEYIKKSSTLFSSQYKGYNHGIAVHSSNPYVLKRIKAINCMIPCGIISTDFSKIAPAMNEDFIELHRDLKFLEIFTPDFISYDIKFLNNGVAKKLKEKFHIPLLGWTVKNEEDQLEAIDYHCDNIIIEGAKSYLY